MLVGVWVIRPPVFIFGHKHFNQLNLFLFKVPSIWSCAHYFQWFTGYLNHVDLLMLHAATCFKETALVINVHLSCFVDFILYPTNKYMFKVNNKNIRLICWMCSNINTAWHSSSVFIVDYDHSQHINIVFLLLTLNKFLPVECKRQVNNVLKTQKTKYLFHNKSSKAYFIQWFIIAPNWNKLWTNDHIMNILWT